MNPNYGHLDLGINIQQVHAVRSERSGRQFERFPIGGALRPLGGLELAVRRSAGWVLRWRQRRAAIRELRALNDHYLKDIGLDRSQVVSPVEEVIGTGGHPVFSTIHQLQWRR